MSIASANRLRILEGGRIFALPAIAGGLMTCWGAVRRWVVVLVVTPSTFEDGPWLRPILGPSPGLARQALAAGILVIGGGIAFVALPDGRARVGAIAGLITSAAWTVLVFHALEIPDPLAMVPNDARHGLDLCPAAPCLQVLTLVEWIEWGAWIALFWGALALVRARSASHPAGGSGPLQRFSAASDLRVLGWLLGISIAIASILYIGFVIVYGTYAGDPP